MSAACTGLLRLSLRAHHLRARAHGASHPTQTHLHPLKLHTACCLCWFVSACSFAVRAGAQGGVESPAGLSEGVRIVASSAYGSRMCILLAKKRKQERHVRKLLNRWHATAAGQHLHAEQPGVYGRVQVLG